MAVDYSVEVCRALEETFYSARLFRPRRIQRYDPGTDLVYNITGVEKNNPAQIQLRVEKFIGGGFAGQVYRVRILNIESNNGPIGGLTVGGIYAMKILVPPSKFARLFRNILYWVGFQGPFQIQVNPTAARAGDQLAAAVGTDAVHLDRAVAAESALVAADMGFAVFDQSGLAALAGRFHLQRHRGCLPSVPLD